MSEVEKKEPVSEEQEVETQIKQYLSEQQNAPEQEQIDKWKGEFGEVFASGFSPTEIYVWRAMRRHEYIQLQVSAQTNNLNTFQLEEATCDLCILWPTGKVWNNEKAGTPHSLSEQIMQNSNFLSPQAAAMLVIKL